MMTVMALLFSVSIDITPPTHSLYPRLAYDTVQTGE